MESQQNQVEHNVLLTHAAALLELARREANATEDSFIVGMRLLVAIVVI